MDVATWRKCSASYALGLWERPPYPPNTIHEHIRRPYHFSCRLLFVLRTYMSMLLDYVIQHGIDGAHRQLCTLSYMMGDYHQVLSRLAL